MKPNFPCPHHPDSERDFSCRYCGKGFCDLCVQAEPGFYRCRGLECVKTFRKEMAGPKTACPFCGHKNPRSFPVCLACGKETSSISASDASALTTVAKFSSVTEA